MQTLDTFTRAYIDAALWRFVKDPNDYIRSIEAGTLATMIGDCQEFLAENADVIGTKYGSAGYNFWLTRNRKGTDFWDGHWPEEAARRLTKAAHTYGSFDLYVGDDGRIYGS